MIRYGIDHVVVINGAIPCSNHSLVTRKSLEKP
ncbi:hypothetical protein ES703_79223 [subsurface metagenome]